jgi:cytochrome b subunit of formate dehydrogenase
MAKQFNMCTVMDASANAWQLIPYETVRLFHMFAALIFIMAVWIFIPYNLLTCGHLLSEIFFIPDAIQLKNQFLSLFGKAEYPRFVIVDEESGHYKNKLHPFVKLMVIPENIAIVLIVLTGVIMYNPEFAIWQTIVEPAILVGVGYYFNAIFVNGKEDMDEYTEIIREPHKEKPAKKGRHPVVVLN